MESLARFRERIPPIPSWGRIAIVLAVALVAYFGFIGVRFFVAENNINTVNLRTAEIDASIGQELPNIDELYSDLEGRNELLAVWKNVFSFDRYQEWQAFFNLEAQQGSDLLVAIVTATAEQAGVQIRAVRSTSPSTEQFEGLTYNGHSMRLSVAAADHFDFFRFIDLLHQGVPIVKVSNITVAGFGADPTADIDIRFFTLEEVEEEKEE